MKRIFCVTDYGAAANDGTLQTAAIQAAIDACYRAGGGEVTIPAGRYRTGGLHLRSRVTLHLLENAVLEGSRDPEDYTGFYDDTVESIAPVEDTDYSRAPALRW
jgi:polygalacturonase